MNRPKRLNLGSGPTAVEGWTNVDFGLGARLARLPLFSALNRRARFFRSQWDSNILIHDLTRPLPFSDESADVVYSSHTLEHFDKATGLAFLAECHRVLKIGGIIRIVVPDLAEFVGRYTRGELAADDFVEQLGVLPDIRDSARLTRFLSPFIAFPHRCMYDEAILLERLEQAGFDAGRRDPFSSDIPDIANVESRHRTVGAVIVEGRKAQFPPDE